MTPLKAGGRPWLALGLALGWLSACDRPPERVVIGVALSRAYHQGVEMAVEEINAEGGIRGVPVELEGLDWVVVDNFDPRDAIGWAKHFAEIEDLVAVIGHSDSASTLAAAPFYNQLEVPQIVTTATNPAITDIGAWTYRLCVSDSVQGAALAEYAVSDWSKRRLALLYVNDDYGRQLASLFQEQAHELGAEVVAAVPLNNSLGAADKQLITRSLAHLAELDFDRPEDLVVLFLRRYGATFALQAISEQEGLTPDVLGGDSIGLPVLAELACDLGLDLRAALFFVPAPGDERATRFSESYLAHYGEVPDYGSAFAYDATYLIRDVAVAGGLSRAGVRQAIEELIERSVPIQGVAGTYVLGPDHDALRQFYIGVAEDGAFRPLQAVGPQ